MHACIHNAEFLAIHKRMHRDTCALDKAVVSHRNMLILSLLLLLPILALHKTLPEEVQGLISHFWMYNSYFGGMLRTQVLTAAFWNFKFLLTLTG
jgi:hypothetical protein